DPDGVDRFIEATELHGARQPHHAVERRDRDPGVLQGQGGAERYRCRRVVDAVALARADRHRHTEFRRQWAAPHAGRQDEHVTVVLATVRRGDDRYDVTSPQKPLGPGVFDDPDTQGLTALD